MVARTIAAETGIEPELSTSGGTSDARFIKDFCPVVEFGPVNRTIHQANENIAVDDLRALTRIYGAVLERYFAQARRMTWLIEAVAALTGAFALAMGRDDAFEHFDLTAEGFWRSFAAVVVIAPLYVYADRVQAVTVYLLQGSDPAPFSPALSRHSLFLSDGSPGRSSLAFSPSGPASALSLPATSPSTTGPRYPVFVVMVIPLVALDLGLIGLQVGYRDGALLLTAALWYRWQIARLALEAPALVALGLVGGDVVLSLAISSPDQRLRASGG